MEAVISFNTVLNWDESNALREIERKMTIPTYGKKILFKLF